MISMDSASLFSSLFTSQNPLARTAPPDAAEGDRNRPDDRRQDVRAEETVSATALAYRRTERTALQIRTQEGDLVRLKFSVKDALSATASTREGDETVVSELSIRARSTTRLKISVQGELNADELAAIQSIVEQAGALANEFFSGGTAEAATLAGSLDLNAEQLDQVRLRLSLRERLTYTQIGTSPIIQPAPPPSTGSTDVPDPVGVSAPTNATTTPTEAQTSVPSTASTTEPVPTDVEPADATTENPAPLFPDVLSAFEAIAAFLTELLEALSAVPGPSETPDDTSSVALRYDVSFKLRVFQSILVSVYDAAGGEQDEALPPVIDEALDTLAAQQQPALVEVI
ncbi:MAG: hypothetical protein OEQ25_07765 [Gammaproteobacteria bacterium]|nr:hypothetical protein [Gammaproteobacteria bacterium]